MSFARTDVKCEHATFAGLAHFHLIVVCSGCFTRWFYIALVGFVSAKLLVLNPVSDMT